MGGRGASSGVSGRKSGASTKNTFTTKFKEGKEYEVNFKNGNPAGTLVIKNLGNFEDKSFGVNKAFYGYAKLNGKTVRVMIAGNEGDVLHFVNDAKRYDIVDIRSKRK